MNPIAAYIDDEGFAIAEHDGEVLGIAIEGEWVHLPGDPDHTRNGFLPLPLAPDQPRPLSNDDADAILERIARAEANQLAAEARLKAVADRLTTEANRFRRKAEWLRRRYAPQMEALAHRELAGMRTRTVNLTHGALAFRRVPASARILDQTAAIAWCEDHRPELLRVTKSVPAKLAMDELCHSLEFGTLEELPPWIEVTPTRDTFRISTGIPSIPRLQPASSSDPDA